MMAVILDPKAAGARRFEGQVAVVTGGGQGIGSATARRLAQEGASIVIGDMVAETSERVRREIQDFGGSCEIALGDLSKWENADSLMATAHEAFGRIDVLANIAGGTIWFQSLQYYTPDQIQAEIDRSFWTAMWCCRAALPYLIEQGLRVHSQYRHPRRDRPVPRPLRRRQGRSDRTDHLAGAGGRPSGNSGQLRRTQWHRGRRPGHASGLWRWDSTSGVARQRARRPGRVPVGDPQLGDTHGAAR